MKKYAVLLAGGLSTRMKQDKTQLQFQGKTLLEYQFEKLVKLEIFDQVYISGERPGFPCINDLERQMGPIEAMRSCLNHIYELKKSWNFSLFFIPVDMPFVNSESINQLVNSEASTDFIKFSSSELPINFFATEKAYKLILKLKLNPDLNNPKSLSVRKLIYCMQGANLNHLNSDQLLNLNTPEEWQNAVSATNHSS